MKLKDLRESYYVHSAKASEIVRQLGLGAIALTWIFKAESGGKIQIPWLLMMAASSIIAALLVDLLQYVLGSGIWAVYHRHKEGQDVGEELEFEAPDLINLPTLFCFWTKIVLTLVGYSFILTFLIKTIRGI